MRPSSRPHYTACPVARPCAGLSVSLSICPVRARNSKGKKYKINVCSQGTSKWSANFQLKRLKVKVTGRQKSQEIAVYLPYMFTVLTSGGRRLGRRLQARPYPLLGLIYCRHLRQTLGKWTNGRISCRRSANTCFLV